VKRILHLATGLGMGGAEMSLANLLAHTDRSEFEPHVLSLGDDRPVGERIRSLDVPVESLGMRPGRITPGDFARLVKVLRRLRPDLVQTWMYHADLLGALAARLAGNPPVVWGIHLTVHDIRGLKRGTQAVIRLNARLSRWLPAAIVCCAESARATHAAIGYDPAKMTVIPNGFDLGRFRPDPAARTALRAELGLPPDCPLVGMGARYHPQKDHANFVRAAASLRESMPGVHFVLWGQGVDPQNAALTGEIVAAGLDDAFHLLGLRQDAPLLAAALDVATLSSAWGEAFPLVVGEAMACGVPCAVTQVGDAAEMVADTGRSVPPRDPSALAAAWRELLALPAAERLALGEQARGRVESLYDIRQTAARYARLHRDIMGHTPG